MGEKTSKTDEKFDNMGEKIYQGRFTNVLSVLKVFPCIRCSMPSSNEGEYTEGCVRCLSTMPYLTEGTWASADFGILGRRLGLVSPRTTECTYQFPSSSPTQCILKILEWYFQFQSNITRCICIVLAHLQICLWQWGIWPPWHIWSVLGYTTSSPRVNTD